MNRDQKAAAIAEIGEALGETSAVYAVDYRGISVTDAAELRTRLREADASFSIVKNRLAKRAVDEAGIEGLDEFLVGPTALTYVRGDAVLAAKAIADFAKTNENLAYKGGILDGAPLDQGQFSSIARLPGVDVLRGQLVGIAASPLTGVVRSLNGLISGLASQLGQIADKGLVGQDAPEPEPAAEPAPAEQEAPAEDGGPAEDEAPAEETSENENENKDSEPESDGEDPEESKED